MNNSSQRKHLLKCTKTKESRWDRIQKKHINSISPILECSTTVNKLFHMNFVTNNQIKKMSSAECINSNSDPALIMQLRHESIRKCSKSANSINGSKELQIDKIKQHNVSIEMKYLENQINKFKEEIAHQRPKSIPTPFLNNNRITKNDDNMLHVNPLDNTKLFASFHNGYEMVQNFYKNSSDASNEEIKILNNNDDADDGENSNHDESSAGENLTSLIMQGTEEQQHQRCVRFDNFVEIINYADNDDEEPSTSQDCSLIDLESSEDSKCENSNNKTAETDNTTNLLAIELTPKKNVELKPLELIGKQVIHDLTDNGQPLLSKSIEPILLPLNEQKPIDENPFRVTKMNLINIEDNNQQSLLPVLSESNETVIEDNSPPNTEQISIINELFAQSVVNNKELDRMLMQKYFLKWTHFTTMQKLASASENLPKNASRIRKIETFLDTIRMEKKKFLRKDPIDTTVNNDGQTKKPNFDNPVILAKKYQNKMKIQQEIIELQKLKLERQERLITELKLSHLSDEARDSKAMIKDELKHVIRTGYQKNRLTAKCLQIANNLKDADDEDYENKLQARGTPKFLIEMEERAMERSKKHKEAQERRERLEQEKEQQKLAAEEAKRQQDEETKRQRIEELRQKRRKEKLLKIQRENDRLQRIENHRKANDFYRTLLLKRFGMERFRILVKIKRYNVRKAIAFRKFTLVKNMFNEWKKIVNDTWAMRKITADNCYRNYLLRMGMNQWKKHHLILESKWLVAMDWYDMKLADHTLQIWDGFTRKCKMIEEVKMRQAEAHYNWHLKWRVVDHWQRLHVILKIEKETEERRQRWRMKIWELLPDYKPNCDNDD